MATRTVSLTLATLLGALVWATNTFAAGGAVTGPNDPAPDRYVYYPGTEALNSDEMRVTACGSGLPASRRAQAGTCWLVELGNGDKFLFDIGSGSMANVASYMIPYNYLDKVFLSHLHTDHIGDLPTLWAGGWTAGRTTPLQVWGPSGLQAHLGTQAAMKGLLAHYAWDYETRAAVLNPIPGEIQVHEFDYKAENQIVYEANGVTIRSFPAIHIGDGPVSFTLEWNDLKFVFSGDTIPNRWFLEFARDADFSIHEAFQLPTQMVEYYNMNPLIAIVVGTKIHTSPQAFGKIMSETQPRLAVAYHFFNEPNTVTQMYDAIRETYAGPLTLATDNRVWNISKDKITEREVVITDYAWSVPAMEPPLARETPPQSMFSPEIIQGGVNMSEVESSMIKAHAERFGVDLSKLPKPPGK